MLKSQLLNKLAGTKATQITRNNLALEVQSNPELIKILLDVMFEQQNDLGIRASWVLEWICRSNLAIIKTHLNYFCGNLNRLTPDGSKRAAAKICELLSLAWHNKSGSVPDFNATHREQLIAACFDWLLGSNTTATKVYSMQSLYCLGHSDSWIHHELKPILIRDYPGSSAGYQARARKLLKLLE
ncbi:MAG: hypothetical protein RLZZ241_2009 [Bacteroidota bacterium]|jgi:hypothetical protein